MFTTVTVLVREYRYCFFLSVSPLTPFIRRVQKNGAFVRKALKGRCIYSFFLIFPF